VTTDDGSYGGGIGIVVSDSDCIYKMAWVNKSSAAFHDISLKIKQELDTAAATYWTGV